jgi:uncharacterized protein (TIGR03437 family)
LQNTVTQSWTTISASGVSWYWSYISPTQINVSYTVPSNQPRGTYTVTVGTTSGNSTAPITIN